ncbi:hydroxylamine reductase [Dysgonomonas macrotermitis]|uniref:Hydroxylamine reductase n=1 Tax=Dysgonomonas macrotermitis TaxID=1346286 RepID=A0A1M5F3X6_9BACT|nr:hydroxylamine reductase [Dysgonomonas macrotermitis]SHF86227.1 hydroxylamine reductase [Dysgonomonas macrotermitis]
MSMFCYQCQETSKGIGCELMGVCGKTPEVSDIQDLLLFVNKGVAVINDALRKEGKASPVADKYVIDAMFMSITNANFDFDALKDKVKEGLALRDELKSQLNTNTSNLPDACTWQGNEDEFMTKAKTVGVLHEQNEDIRSLKELIHYGLKGMAAYGEHAYNLDKKDDELYRFMQHALAEITREDISADELIALTLETGKYGVQGMALLDAANTGRYGNPEMTQVNIGVGKNPGILISGHDLRDIEDLLIQTEGTGVDVYTHSEMLPAHYYPQLKKYKHLVGNYGGAWWQQKDDFETFNGPILFTTNCIVPPSKSASYIGKIFTTGAAGLTGARHIADRKDGQSKDFSEIIALAKTCQAPKQIEEGTILGGFAHAQVLALADKVVDAVQSGAIKKFFVMGGCDGRMKSRQYYTDFAQALPQDTVILTAGCAKYRYNKLPLGDINGIPRMLDAGQCNDCYSLAVIALKLKEVFGLDDINKLPIVYNIAWYEQKAVIVLLALLHLGVKNIHLGPTLPGFLSPNVAKVLVENFGIGSITNVDDDMKMFLAS